MPVVANAGVAVYAGLMYGLEKKLKPGVCARQLNVLLAEQRGTLLLTERSSLS